ncbi:DUF2268 domain-containing protein [Bacillus sp. Bva_UNVM-123]|uniref:DUF2268 domain-containing protein n=1 Tax=Bacillus sp. Bva_UNVM-123 TaxID=2829798 RepID=UPI00391FA9BB
MRTDEWLEGNFRDPIKICQRLQKVFAEENPQKIYHYLMTFGMYKPNRQTYNHFEKLKEQKMWEKIKKIYLKYKRKWNGPNVEIYLFPIAAKNSIFSISENVKSGIAFKDKIFLFITPFKDETELEALFVHEYHHTCRLIKQNKPLEELTLLDSIVLEGLAEYAVEVCCGSKYRTKWCTYYSRKEITYFWKKYIQDRLEIKKNKKIHDEILFGRKNIPQMLGYAAGYEIVSIYKERNNLTMKESFLLPSENFILRKEILFKL